jgi:DNA-binding NtrC family response regulator
MPPTILFVDDENDLCFLVKCICGEKYNCLTYTKGTLALEAVRNGAHYDLAIIDYRLPDISAEQLTQELKKANPNCPIVLTSAHYLSDLPPEVAAYRFLKKPFPPQELESTIKECLRK